MSTANVSRCFDVNFSTEPVSTFHTPCGKFLWRIQPPLKGEAAHSAGGVSGGTQNPIWNAPRRIRRDPCCPLWGKCRAAAKGVPSVALSCFHSTNHTPSVSLAGSEVPSSLPAPPSGSQEIVRIRLRFHKTVSACCNPSAAAAAAQLCIKRLYAVKDGYTR